MLSELFKYVFKELSFSVMEFLEVPKGGQSRGLGLHNIRHGGLGNRIPNPEPPRNPEHPRKTRILFPQAMFSNIEIRQLNSRLMQV